MLRPFRIEILLFLATFFAFAFFNQGGGWNQNSRFAEVRAIVEECRFPIDDFLIYRVDPPGNDLVRIPVHNTAYDFEGKHFRLAWVDMTYSMIPMNTAVAGEDAPMVELCCSGDIGYVPQTTHFHPNKPPGTSFLAVPAYWLILHVERALGVNPDHAWPVTVNVWLTTIFSVGLVAALGCVLFFRLAREFAGGAEWPAVLATLALAFGTTFFPFGTILFDHNLTASLLIASLYFLRREEHWRAELPRRRSGEPPTPASQELRPPDAARSSAIAFLFAGACAGLAVLTNYVAVGAVGALALYALLSRSTITAPRDWSWRRGVLFALGGIPFAVLLGWYHTVNFGSPFQVANNFQNPVFKDDSGSLGMFMLPTSADSASHFVYVSAILSVSPYRGVFWLCPVLIAGVAGIGTWLVEKKWVPEARLCLAIFAFFFFVNASFNGYHGGYAAGPRYLVPGIPFLALGLVVAFVRWKNIALVLLALSVAQQLLLTATDAQNALAVGGHARLDDAHRKDDFFCNIVTEYAAPFFFKGRAEGLLRRLFEAKLDTERARLDAESDDPDEIQRQLAAKRAEWQASIDAGEQTPFLLAAIRGPVSINPVGVYDGLLGFGNFDMHSPQAAWNSCNLGEFLWPQSRWSLLPLLLVSGGLSALAVRLARRGAAAKRGEAASKKQTLSS
ncbi:MAG TPA: hypothetical protein VEO95_10270 [Chthoniobacteraceae bacterium]|nr:hypothetical protein [Chthoniobacteraceae bacterium]